MTARSNFMKFTGKQGWMNQFFGGDPDPGKKKKFAITVATEQGVQNTKMIPEDENILIAVKIFSSTRT